MTTHGRHDGYHWLWSAEGRLSEVLQAVPELVLGQIVAVTALDSGPFRPSADDVVAGWTVERDVAFSPRIRDVPQLPLDQWDEWYVLAERRVLPALHVFVNYGNFTPDPEPPLRHLEPTWDRIAAVEEQRLAKEQAERFWHQLLAVQPAAFLAQGDTLTCVIASETLFTKVLAVVGRGAG